MFFLLFWNSNCDEKESEENERAKDQRQTIYFKLPKGDQLELLLSMLTSVVSTYMYK